MGSDAQVMGQFVLPAGLRALGWIIAAVMTAATLAMLWLTFLQKA